MKSKQGIIFPIFLLVGVIAASVLRYFQYMSLIDFSTGFFYDGAEFGGIFLYILMGVLAVAAVVLLIFGKKNNVSAHFVSSDGMGSHATQILGIFEMIGALLAALRFYGSLMFAMNRDNGTDMSTGINALFGDQFERSSSVPVLICTAGITVILFVSSLMQFRNIVPPPIAGHIKIIAAGLMFPVIADYYSSDLIMHQRSDKLIVILSYIMIGAFLASTARFYSRLETPNSRMRELVTSAMTFILCTVHVLPKLLAYVFGGTVTERLSSIDLIVAAGMLMSGAFIGTLFFTERKKDIVPVIYEDDQLGKKQKEDEDNE